MADEGLVPGGTARNIAAAEPFTTYDVDVTPAERILLADAQTSGGLLLAVNPERLGELLAALKRESTLGRGGDRTVGGGGDWRRPGFVLTPCPPLRQAERGTRD